MFDLLKTSTLWSKTKQNNQLDFSPARNLAVVVAVVVFNVFSFLCFLFFFYSHRRLQHRSRTPARKPEPKKTTYRRRRLVGCSFRNVFGPSGPRQVTCLLVNHRTGDFNGINWYNLMVNNSKKWLIVVNTG